MSFPAPSDISQNDTEILKKQRQEMQWRHEKEQQLLAQLEEVAKLSAWLRKLGGKQRPKPRKRLRG